MSYPKPRNRGVVSPFYRRFEVVELLRGTALLERCVAAGWLAPVVKAPKLVLFKRDDVLSVIARLSAGEVPPTCYRNEKGAS